MMTIRQLIDYYDGEITFNQIMLLFIEKKVSLEGGIASPDDARAICDTYNLKSVDLRDMGVQQSLGSIVERVSDQAGESTFDGLEAKASDINKDIYTLEKNLRKARKKSNGNKDRVLASILREEYSSLVELAETYEELFGMESDKDYLEKAARSRRRADALWDDPSNRGDWRARARNIFRLAEIETIMGDNDSAVLHFNEAKVLYEQVLESIKSVDSKIRAEENALIGRVHLRLYGITNQAKLLNSAYTIFSSYCKADTSGKYDQDFEKVKDLMGKSGEKK